ncbi:MAG: polymerase delta prime subunit [Betaproteobacteria bacterium]|nr:polymerase delta prime subunit [Betaproteobacteria bacterium]
MKELKYRWLEPAWEQLQAQRERLPHALLIYGPPHIGKRELAEHFAQSLLCETPAGGGHPCGTCNACRWFGDGNHPDYRAVLPEILQPADAEAGGETAESGEGATGSKSKAPSKEIKIEQIRSLDTFFGIGTHRGGAKVVMLYPADALNQASGNALLKTLEEPSAGTVFLLVSSRLDHLLPTIKSRTAKFAVAPPSPAQALAWLQEQGVRDPEMALAEAGGAPLAALRKGEDESAAEMRTMLIDALTSARALDPISTAEKCDKAGAELLTLWLTQWVADLILHRNSGKVRYYPQQIKSIEKLAAAADLPGLFRLYRSLLAARRMAGHPLNVRLVAEDLLIDYARVIHS